MSPCQEWASQLVPVVKNPPANAGDTRNMGSISGSERCPGEGNDKPLQYSCLETSMDRGAWPWGLKESDTTEHAHAYAPLSVRPPSSPSVSTGRFCMTVPLFWGFPGGSSGKEPACRCRRHKRCWFDPWVREISWRGKWLPTQVCSPGEVHGQRSLGGYSSWGRKEWDMTKATEQAHINSGSTEENHGKW